MSGHKWLSQPYCDLDYGSVDGCGGTLAAKRRGQRCRRRGVGYAQYQEQVQHRRGRLGPGPDTRATGQGFRAIRFMD
jgi:hypothetical protein